MSSYKQDILNYAEDVNDMDSIPFESLRMLHDRSSIQRVYDQLDFDEKVHLALYDLKLIEHAEKMVEHISKVYDFNLSDEKQIPLDEWWWHLNKIVKGTMDFGVSTGVGKVM